MLKRVAVAVLLSVLIAACRSGPTAEQRAHLHTYDNDMIAEAVAKKITWTEYAQQTNAQFQAVWAGDPRVDSTKGQAALAYRVFLASEIDAGRSTFERFNYEWKSFVARLEAGEEAERQAALAQASANMMALGAAMRARSSFDCTSTRFGNITTTNCD